jgi:enhancing lycopene biosynthesis protein 2
LTFTQEKCYVLPERSEIMSRTWQTDEVIRQLADADLDELAEVIKEAGDGAAEALADWIREGNGPKSLYDAVMRFTQAPDHSFDPVDWEAVVRWIREESGSNNW